MRWIKEIRHKRGKKIGRLKVKEWWKRTRWIEWSKEKDLEKKDEEGKLIEENVDEEMQRIGFRKRWKPGNEKLYRKGTWK